VNVLKGKMLKKIEENWIKKIKNYERIKFVCKSGVCEKKRSYKLF
jgi:hypothetical protein